jgi:tryptophan halogenase
MEKTTGENGLRMTKAIRSIVIVGGGSAGWIAAGRIAAKHQSNQANGIQVTLIESPYIKTIGVGEGTWPTMRNTLKQMGISETELLIQCDATFKQGAKFSQWVTGTKDDYYYHPLMLPQGFTAINPAPYWQQSQGQKQSYSNTVCFQEQLCEQGLAPKNITTAEYDSVANYAYHLDAGKFSNFLKEHCTKKLGVKYIADEVTVVNSAKNGDIESLTSKQHGDICGDLFVDCSGFTSLLLGQHYKIPFIDKSDVLFIDNAITVQVPYTSEASPIASHTISTAQEAGWIWDIGLTQRKGVGHVYSSRHTSKQDAERALAEYVGPQIEQLEVRHIPIKSGHRAKFWQNNCVAVGLSAGFLEPLEASALVLIELAADMISEQLPACREVMDISANRFNQTFLYRWQRIVEFLKLHYVLSKRSLPFWVDNRDPDTIPSELQDMLKYWRYHPPSDQDFTSNNEVFPAASYQYVLYGMGFQTDTSLSTQIYNQQKKAQRYFAQNQDIVTQVTAGLPSNRDLLNKVHKYGFQKI